eukprot:8283673-Alexandrium_andersonii.AAC.1
MSASLVGSEMCIRDSACAGGAFGRPRAFVQQHKRNSAESRRQTAHGSCCLLYTSDAADDM